MHEGCLRHAPRRDHRATCSRSGPRTRLAAGSHDGAFVPSIRSSRRQENRPDACHCAWRAPDAGCSAPRTVMARHCPSHAEHPQCQQVGIQCRDLAERLDLGVPARQPGGVDIIFRASAHAGKAKLARSFVQPRPIHPGPQPVQRSTWRSSFNVCQYAESSGHV